MAPDLSKAECAELGFGFSIVAISTVAINRHKASNVVVEGARCSALQARQYSGRHELARLREMWLAPCDEIGGSNNGSFAYHQYGKSPCWMLGTTVSPILQPRAHNHRGTRTARYCSHRTPPPPCTARGSRPDPGPGRGIGHTSHRSSGHAQAQESPADRHPLCAVQHEQDGK